MFNNSVLRPVLAVVMSAVAFWSCHVLQALFGAGIDAGVDNPYLPAGIRLIAVSVFGMAGAIGLILGGLPAAYASFPGGGALTWLLLALINGLCPLLALSLIRRAFGIGDRLLELSFHALLVLVALQSTLSPLLYQGLFMATGIATASAYNLVAMIVGDFVGSMLLLSVVAFGWDLLRRR